MSFIFFQLLLNSFESFTAFAIPVAPPARVLTALNHANSGMRGSTPPVFEMGKTLGI